LTPSFPTQPLRDATSLAGDARALRRRAKQDGYLFFPGSLDRDDVLALRHEVLERCRRRGWLDPRSQVDEGRGLPSIELGAYDDAWVDLQREVHVLPEFAALRAAPFVLGVLERLFGEPPLDGQGDTCRLMSPAARALTTRPHQDRFYVRRSDRLWTVWIPLGDCPIELGGLAVLPGSNRGGLLPHSGEGEGRQGAEVSPDETWAIADYECGDVLMFSCLTLHRAAENATRNTLRASADFRYVPASVGPAG
jgi:ectoine hydroxylase-related dioxygenase (phytanoyl-CoA dioxygenase family)